MSALISALAALALLPAAQPVQPSGERLDALLAQADLDGDGAVTREEYDLARSRAFDRMDQNADGFLDESDRAAAPSLQRPGHAPDPRVRAALTALEQGRERTRPPADADGDGLISEAEFPATPAPGFDRADRNADGVLSAEELAAIQDRPARRLRQTP